MDKSKYKTRRYATKPAYNQLTESMVDHQPHAMSLTKNPCGSAIWTGASLLAVSPRLSWPRLPQPLANALPHAVNSTVWRDPQAT